MVRLQGELGTQTLLLVAERNGRRLGQISLYVAGSRRFPQLDRVFMRTVLVPDEPAIVASADGAVEALLASADEEAVRLGAVAISWNVPMPRHVDAGTFTARGYEVQPQGVGLIELPTTEEEIEACLAHAARKQTRKAEKAGMRVDVAPDCAPLLPLLDLSFRRSGRPVRSHEYVRRAHALLQGEVLVARIGDEDMAALLWAPFGEVGLNIFHGRRDGDTQGAADLLHREMFRRALRRGVRIVHTGGAALPGDTDPHLRGITQFKRKMGFEVRVALGARRILRPRANAVRSRLRDGWAWLRAAPS
jgi:hypothetical protein